MGSAIDSITDEIDSDSDSEYLNEDEDEFEP